MGNSVRRRATAPLIPLSERIGRRSDYHCKRAVNFGRSSYTGGCCSGTPDVEYRGATILNPSEVQAENCRNSLLDLLAPISRRIRRSTGVSSANPAFSRCVSDQTAGLCGKRTLPPLLSSQKDLRVQLLLAKVAGESDSLLDDVLIKTAFVHRIADKHSTVSGLFLDSRPPGN